MSKNPIVLISEAERRLEEVSEIVDILDYRDHVRAIEAMLKVIDGAVELQQRATLLRLKAERKAGGWLSQNIEIGNPQWRQQSSSSTLAELGISKNQSSRWQLFARLPDEKFDRWVDEHVSKGWDITASGLVRYAMNSTNGRYPTPRVTSIMLVVPRGTCCLRGFIVDCVGDLQGHHLISKNMARGNDEVRDILRACPPELISDVCLEHNVGKYADAHEARRILLLQKVYLFGFEHMRQFIDDLPWKVKSHELTLASMLEAKEIKT